MTGAGPSTGAAARNFKLNAATDPVIRTGRQVVFRRVTGTVLDSESKSTARSESQNRDSVNLKPRAGPPGRPGQGRAAAGGSRRALASSGLKVHRDCERQADTA